MSTVSLSPSPTSQHPHHLSQCSPWLTPIAYFLGEKIVLPGYFGQVAIVGQEHLPHQGPVILAPTHRARWDSIVIPYAAGRSVTGRDLHFMVTSDEVQGLQGWFIRRLGGFAINVRSPSIASLRHGIELLQHEQMMVIYPEGGIFRDRQVHRLKPGLARIALQAEAQTHELGVKIIPVSLYYDPAVPRWRGHVEVAFGPPLSVDTYLPTQENRALTAEEVKSSARYLIEDLAHNLTDLSTTQQQRIETNL
ncbi:1-acyl-sn-glycerol-3-phosphate acyltransferase [Leptolyngbya iicbica LK]|uniref:1-acyl-sn-glycerol-3-phosphate acyltransferase n=3 Tax=Cyanophyceae TaxID=3028117 RepID=A0A4Q7EB32_9CYAN|nr:1-acyl-sn-glycerol-3-phosphate acyltransferase [Leptolyngbya sp. LK]